MRDRMDEIMHKIQDSLAFAKKQHKKVLSQFLQKISKKCLNKVFHKSVSIKFSKKGKKDTSIFFYGSAREGQCRLLVSA
jgi:hypothetical protein